MLLYYLTVLHPHLVRHKQNKMNFHSERGYLLGHHSGVCCLAKARFIESIKGLCDLKR